MTGKQEQRGVTGGEERVKEQTVRALPAIVKESVFHPKSCGKICPSLPPLCICPPPS